MVGELKRIPKAKDMPPMILDCDWVIWGLRGVHIFRYLSVPNARIKKTLAKPFEYDIMRVALQIYMVTGPTW